MGEEWRECNMFVLTFRRLHRLDHELAAIATVNILPIANHHGRQYGSREDALVATVTKERAGAV